MKSLSYQSETLVKGRWTKLKSHTSARAARKAAGERGRVVRVTMEVLKEHEVR